MLQNKRLFKHHRLAALLLASSALTLSTPVLACGIEPLIGEVCMFAYDFCPEGYIEASGQTLPINQYQALYSLIGTRFGGNGTTYFVLPDLRGRTMIGRGTPNGETTNYQVGTSYGKFSTQLDATQLPAHGHTATLTAGSQTITASLPVSTLVGSTSGAVSALAAGQTGYLAGISGKVGVPSVNFTGPYTTTAPVAGSTASLPVTASVSGGSVSVAPTPVSTVKVPTVTPSVAMTACIAAQGIYPQRP